MSSSCFFSVHLLIYLFFENPTCLCCCECGAKSEFPAFCRSDKQFPTPNHKMQVVSLLKRGHFLVFWPDYVHTSGICLHESSWIYSRGDFRRGRRSDVTKKGNIFFFPQSGHRKAFHYVRKTGVSRPTLWEDEGGGMVTLRLTGFPEVSHVTSGPLWVVVGSNMKHVQGKTRQTAEVVAHH